MNIYLAGPICGLTLSEAEDWRVYAKEHLHPELSVINPLRTKEPDMDPAEVIGQVFEQGAHATFQAVAGRCLFDVGRTDVILAYMPDNWPKNEIEWPSIGTLIEIGWARAAGIPVVLACQDKRIVGHPLIDNACPWIVFTLAEAIKVVNDITEDYL